MATNHTRSSIYKTLNFYTPTARFLDTENTCGALIYTANGSDGAALALLT